MEENSWIWPQIDWNSQGTMIDEATPMRDVNQPGYSVHDRWASRPDEARFVGGSPLSLYRFGRLEQGRLVGSFKQLDEQSYDGYVEGRTKIFELTTKSGQPGQIECSRTRVWLQR
jgi:hypothetical protein